MRLSNVREMATFMIQNSLNAEKVALESFSRHFSTGNKFYMVSINHKHQKGVCKRTVAYI